MTIEEVGGAPVELTLFAQWISRRSLSSASRMSCCASKRFVMSTCAVDAETKSCVRRSDDDADDDERDEHLGEREAALSGESTAAAAAAYRRRRITRGAGSWRRVSAWTDSSVSPASCAACSFRARSSAITKSWWFGAAAAAMSRSTAPVSTSSISAAVRVCMWKNSPSAIASVISSALSSRMRSAIRLFVDHDLERRHAAAVACAERAAG